MSKIPIVLMWFRQDLRLRDNPALNAAIEMAKSQQVALAPIYIHDDQNALGAASSVWLHHSLQALITSLVDRCGLPLSLFNTNDPMALFQLLNQQYELKAIYWNRCYEPIRVEQDQNIKTYLKAEGVVCQSFNGSLLWEPWDITKADGSPYQVFTPFFRNGCLPSAIAPRVPLDLADLAGLVVPAVSPINACELEALNLLPNLLWGSEMMSHWEVGESAARNALLQFLECGLRGYKEQRNVPALLNTSRLSPHLHFGEMSPNQIWYAAKAKSIESALDTDIDHFCTELAWREFSYHFLYRRPDMPSRNLQKKFDAFPWQNNAALLRAWQRGLTGYPIVDAGMRELWQTGFMHNRVRMIVASFLIKNLLVDWRLGAKWFLDCLVDADLANNSASWQWVAGCGADAAPFFRVFNPVLQGEKFDTDGVYTKRFVPELKQMPAKYLFCPWNAPASVLQQAGVCLGDNYPQPIVDLRRSRDLVLSHFKSL